MNRSVKFDFDSKFCRISVIRKQIWKFFTKNKSEASKAPHQQKKRFCKLQS